MKRFLQALGVFGTLASPALGAVTYELYFDTLRRADNAPVADSTIVILVANTDTISGGLPGGVDGSDITTNQLDPAAAYDDFNGVELTAGMTTNNGDEIFYVAQLDGVFGAGSITDTTTLANISYSGGLAAGQEFGVYWFPGVTTIGETLGIGAFEVGGFHNPNANTTLSDVGMILQSDTSGSVHTIYQIDENIAAGFGEASTITNDSFTAVLVPEPSTGLLALLGLGLLRRRR